MSRGLVGQRVAASIVCGADASSAVIGTNTIDEFATLAQDGAAVRATGPISCTSGERVSMRVTVTQRSTGARARTRCRQCCAGEVQHWRLRAGERPFEAVSGRACAVARTRAGRRVTNRKCWREPVSLASGL